MTETVPGKPAGPWAPAAQTPVATGTPPQCPCMQGSFAALPPELRPRAASQKGNLRKVTCPGCGSVYWTNRQTDLCMNCEKKGVRLPEPPAPQET